MLNEAVYKWLNVLQYLTPRWVLIASNINDLLAGKNIGMFSSYVSSDELNERYLRVLDDSWITLFVNAIKYFVENIERRSDFQEFI